MKSLLGVLVVLGAALSVAQAPPARADECFTDATGDANVVNAIATLAVPSAPALGPSDPLADVVGVCVAENATAIVVRFDVADDTAPETLGRQFSAQLTNFSGCFDLTVIYQRGTDGDAASAIASEPDGCEPPPWFVGNSFPVQGAVASHTSGTNQFAVTVPIASVLDAVVPVLGYDPGPGYWFDSASSSYANPAGLGEPTIDRCYA